MPWLVATLAVAAPSPARGQCPSEEELTKHLAQVPLELASRTKSFSVPAPRPLYEKAIKKIGKVETRREGSKGLAVVVVALPIETLWRAINDEAKHAEGEYLLVQRSEVIGGTPRGESRKVFQAGSKMGIGRFWVTDTWMNGELFARSGETLWEVVWEGEDQPATPPVDDPPKLEPVAWTRGAWLLSPITDGCTSVEHFSWSEPGGLVGAMQGMLLGKALRESVAGMVRMADERYRDPPPGPPFLRPDGQPLE